jgi:hypothetical protein
MLLYHPPTTFVKCERLQSLCITHHLHIGTAFSRQVQSRTLKVDNKRGEWYQWPMRNRLRHRAEEAAIKNRNPRRNGMKEIR